MNMYALFAVALGGALGSVCRYSLDRAVSKPAAGAFLALPAGTLAVNLCGCFLIGLLWGVFDRIHIGNTFRLFLFTGFLGGLTTFSTFARESEQLLRCGSVGSGMLYVMISNLFGIAMVALGFFLTSKFFR